MAVSRKGRIFLAVALLGMLVAVPIGASSAPDGDPLREDLDALLTDPSLAGADVGLVVRRADNGETLYQHQADRRRQPASNAKLLTAASALEVLGPQHRFRTSVETDGQSSGAELDGDLYLRGGGDPTMLAADYDGLAARIAESGIRTVTGKLVADDTYFDDVRLGFGWAWDDEPYYYSAPTSGLTIAPDTDYDAGAVKVTVTPGAAGAKPEVSLDPPNSLITVENAATTGEPGSDEALTVDRAHGTKAITVSGSVPAEGAPVAESMAAPDPSALTASVFRDALARHGVEVTGDTGAGSTPDGARVLADRSSMSLAELLTPMLKLSNNMHSESLAKTAGRVSGGEGNWDDGLAALGKALPGMGVDPASASLVDGSGLSRMDQLTPQQLADLLLAVRAKPWFGGFYDALPVAGNPDRMVGGTLRSRMAGTPAEGKVHAKTGSYTGVSALSGYVTAADGTELVFSMIGNQTLGSPRAIEDAVAVRLAGYAGENDERAEASVPAQRIPQQRVGDTQSQLECSWTKSC